MFRKSRPPATTIDRKVLFYRVIPLPGERPALDAQAIHAAVEACAVRGERFIELDEGERVRVNPHRIGKHVGLSIGKLRAMNLPRFENRMTGANRPLQVADDDDLVEETHAVVFPDGVIGIESNFYGPQIGALSGFLTQRCGEIPKIRPELIMNQDAARLADSFQNVRVVTLRIRRGYSDLMNVTDRPMQTADNLVEEVMRNVDGELFEAVIRRAKRSRLPLLEPALAWVKKTARSPRLKEGADIFKVKGGVVDNGHLVSREYDLLKDRLISVQAVPRAEGRHRGVSSEHMLAAIVAAHDELQDKLYSGAGVEL